MHTPHVVTLGSISQTLFLACSDLVPRDAHSGTFERLGIASIVMVIGEQFMHPSKSGQL